MTNNKKIKSFHEDGEVNTRSCASSVKSKERHASKNNTMSTDTKDFIQKICYRKTASIDMTQYGFINDSKVNPVNYIIKLLRDQLERICAMRFRFRKVRIQNDPISPLPAVTRDKKVRLVSPRRSMGMNVGKKK